MKKILFLLSISMALAITSMSQTAMANANGFVLDTVTNTTAEGPVVTVKGFASTVSFVMLVTKISGTIAGTVTLQGSNQITKGYQNITGTNDQVTFTLTDVAAQTVVLSQTPKKFLYYRVLITGSGTMSASYSAAAYTTKE